ncbi:MAG: hypothetical protein RIC16_16285 [Rhodospirillales bacterium]
MSSDQYTSPGPEAELVLTRQCMETFFDLLVQCWNEFDRAKYEHKDTKRLLEQLTDILLKGDYASTVATAATLIRRSGGDLPASYQTAMELAQKYHGQQQS